MVRVAGFQPSTSGLHFPNDFPHVPLRTLEDPDVPVGLTIGNASLGLCGGMAYAVRDYFEAGLLPPPDRTPPADGPLFAYLVDRLFDSFHLPSGVLRYLYLMNPLLPDHGVAGLPAEFPLSRAGIVIEQEWPKIKADLDGGHPSPLGLIKVKSSDPRQLGVNHQVLAYGYDLDGTNLTLHLYDPNAPDDDNATLALSLANPDQPTPITCSTAPTVYCFFRTEYAVGGPPPLGSPRTA